MFRVINGRRLFEHPGRTLLSIAGVALGAALVVSVLGFIGTLDGSVEELVRGVSGVADLEVSATSREGFSDSLYFEVERTPGVRAAVPLVRSPALISGVRALVIGVDERARRLGTALGAAAPAGPEGAARFGGLFLGEPLAQRIGARPGDVVHVYAGGRRTKIAIGGTIRDQAAKLNAGLVAVAALPIAQRVTGDPGKLDSILVIAENGALVPRLSAALSAKLGPRVSVESPFERVRRARAVTRDIRNPMVLGAGIAVVVGAFLIYNTMSMAAAERRRELAILRALGGGRTKLLGAFLAEAAALGGVGSLIGVAAGIAATQLMIGRIPSFVLSAVQVQVSYHLPPYAVPVAITAAIGGCLAAAALPGWRATGVSPVESMRPEGVLETIDGADRIAWGTTAAGAAMLASGVVFPLWISPATGFIWLGVFMVGVIVTSYGLTPVLSKLTATAVLPLGTVGRLAAAAVERAPRRAWATSVAVVIAASMVVSQRGIFDNVDDSVTSLIRTLSKIDLYVSASPADVISDEVRLPPGWEAHLAAIPGVVNVGKNLFSFVTYEGEQVLLQGVEDSVRETPSLAQISPEDFRAVESGQGAVVSTRFTDLYGVGEGDVVVLPTPTGPREVPVVASVPAFTWERGMVTVGRRVLAGAFGISGVSDFMVTLSEGADRRAVRAAVGRFVRAAPFPVYVTSGAETVEAIRGSVAAAEDIFSAMTSVVLGAATLGVFNALLISVVERRRELGIMRALGTSRRQIRRMVGVEAGAVGILGAIAGATLGFVVHRVSLSTIVQQSGFPIDYEFVAAPASMAVGIGLLIAVAGSILPAARAGAVNVIEAIGYE